MQESACQPAGTLASSWHTTSTPGGDDDLVFICRNGVSPGTADTPYSRIGVDVGSVGVTDGNEHIDMLSGGLSLAYTDYCVPGAFGLDMCVTRTYSSKVLDESLAEVNVDVWAGAGWSVLVGGRLYFDSGTTNYVWVQLPGGAQQQAVVVDSASAYYRTSSSSNALPGMTSSYTEIYVTDDFTFVYRTAGSEYKAITTEGVLYTFDTTSTHTDGWYYGETVENAYGDEISITYDTTCATGTYGSGAIDEMQDALGRVLAFSSDANCHLSGFSYTDFSGSSQSISYSVGSSSRELEAVTLPTGESTTYDYTTANTGEVTDITLPTGGTVEYTYATIDFLWDYSSGEVTYDTRVIDDKTTSPDSATTYYWDFTWDDYSTSSTPASTAIRYNYVVNPDLTWTVHQFYATSYTGTGSSALVSHPGLVGLPYKTSWYDTTSSSTPTRVVLYSYADAGDTAWGINGPELSTTTGAYGHTSSATARAIVPTYVATYVDGVLSLYTEFGEFSAGEYDDYGNALQAADSYEESYWSTGVGLYYGDIREYDYSWDGSGTLEGWNRVRLVDTESYGAGSGSITTTYGEVDRVWSETAGEEGWLTSETHSTYPADNLSDDIDRTYTYDIDTTTGDLEIEVDHGGLRTEYRRFEAGTLQELAWDDGSGGEDTVFSRVVESETGLVSSETDAASNTTTFDYDAVGRLVEQAPPLDDESTWAYNLTSSPPTIVVTTGTSVTTTTLDELGRVIETEVDNGTGVTSVTEVELDHLGRAATAYEPHAGSGTAGAYTETIWDSSERVTERTFSDGTTDLTTSVSYAFPDVTTTDPESYVWSHTVNGYGETDTTSPPLGATTEMAQHGGVTTCPVTTSSYCQVNLTNVYDSSSTLQQQVRYLDGSGRMWRLEDDQSGWREFWQDASGAEYCSPDEEGDLVYREFDSWGRVLDVFYETYTGSTPAAADCTGSTPVQSFYYDGDLPTGPTWTADNAEGRLSAVEDESGHTLYSYDEQGRVESMEVQVGPGNFRTTLDSTYDAEGNLSDYTMTFGSQVFTTSLTHGEGGRAESISASGTRTAGTFAFDVVTDMTYLPTGEPGTIEYDSGVTYTRTLDDYGRLETLDTTGVDDPGGSPDELSLTYGYDDRGYVETIEEADGTTTFTMDDIGRLTDVEYGDDSTDIAYVWDDFGNLEDRTGSAATALGIAFSGRTFSDNQESAATYDDMGRMTDDGASTYDWDAADRMTEKTLGADSTELFYNHAGALAVEIEHRGSGTTINRYVHDSSGRLIARFESAPGSSPKLAAYYVYASGIALPVAIIKVAGAQIGYDAIHYDHLGTPRLSSNAAGVTREKLEKTPFGVNRDRSGPIVQRDVRFAGHAAFVMGSADFGARQYGRVYPQFLSPDTVQIGSAANAMSMNRYAYAMGSPLSFVDPTGWASVEAQAAAAWAQGQYDTNPTAYSDSSWSPTFPLRLAGFSKCNMFVAAAYLDGAGVDYSAYPHVSNIYFGRSAGPFYRPATSAELADPSAFSSQLSYSSSASDIDVGSILVYAGAGVTGHTALVTGQNASGDWMVTYAGGGDKLKQSTVTTLNNKKGVSPVVRNVLNPTPAVINQSYADVVHQSAMK